MIDETPDSPPPAPPETPLSSTSLPVRDGPPSPPPTIGRIVLYRATGDDLGVSPGDEYPYSRDYAAIITGMNLGGTVNLQIFDDPGRPIFGGLHRRSVAEGDTGGTWHWPTRV